METIIIIIINIIDVGVVITTVVMLEVDVHIIIALKLQIIFITIVIIVMIIFVVLIVVVMALIVVVVVGDLIVIRQGDPLLQVFVVGMHRLEVDPFGGLPCALECIDVVVVVAVMLLRDTAHPLRGQEGGGGATVSYMHC